MGGLSTATAPVARVDLAGVTDAVLLIDRRGAMAIQDRLLSFQFLPVPKVMYKTYECRIPQ
jgi:hypothetical protein